MPARKPAPVPAINELPDNALLRLPVVLALTGYSRSGWYYGIERGVFPKPVKIGLRSVGWRAGEIRKLLDVEPVAEVPAHTKMAVAARKEKAALAARSAESI